jgi:hypothetical protein
MMHPAARDEIVGALPPPAGVSPNFNDPESVGYIVIVTNTIFLPLASLILALRIYTRRVIVGGIYIDDCKYPCVEDGMPS